MKKLWLILAALSLITLVACGKDSDSETSGKTENQEKFAETQEEMDKQEVPTKLIQFEPLSGNEREVEMVTSLGSIKIKLFPDQAPKAVENFITHAKDGYYDGLIFHRIIKDFMIQGGDPLGTGMGGESIWGKDKPFEDEFSKALYNFRGSLSMANSGSNTNGSQFFINQAGAEALKANGATEQVLVDGGWPEIAAKKYMEVGGNPTLDSKHTVFGQVTEGMDIVDKIANVETKEDKPLKDVKIVKINIIK